MFVIGKSFLSENVYCCLVEKASVWMWPNIWNKIFFLSFLGRGGGEVVVEGKSILYVSIYNEYVYLNSKKTNQLKYMASINLNIWHG